MEDSIFTKIINGDIPSFTLYEDEKTIAFLDIHPASKGHTLVVPKVQIDHLDDLSDADYAAVFTTVKLLTKQLKTAFNPVRVGLVVKGFDVPHAHVHVIPLYDGESAIPTPPHVDLDAEPDFDALKKIHSELTSS